MAYEGYQNGATYDGYMSLDTSAYQGNQNLAVIPTQVYSRAAPSGGLVFPSPMLPSPRPRNPYTEPVAHNTGQSKDESFACNSGSAAAAQTGGPTEPPVADIDPSHGPPLAKSEDISGLTGQGRSQFSPNAAPGTPSSSSTLTTQSWIWHRPVSERMSMNLKKDDLLKRVTRKKHGRAEDPQKYYGPPIGQPKAWGPVNKKTNRPIFEYTQQGTLLPNRQYTVSEMKQFLYARPLKNAEVEWVDREYDHTVRHIPDRIRQGLTGWISWPPAQCTYRFPHPPHCLFENCPMRRIRVGVPIVVLDEHKNDEGLEIDPFHNAGYVHLYCLERNFDLVKLLQDLDLRLDERRFKHEEANFFSLTKDVGAELIQTYRRWWAREYPRYVAARAEGKSRARKPYQDVSLSAALLKCKFYCESNARERNRAIRGGNDWTRHWGDLHLLQKLTEQKRNDRMHKRAEELETESEPEDNGTEPKAESPVRDASSQTSPSIDPLARARQTQAAHDPRDAQYRQPLPAAAVEGLDGLHLRQAYPVEGYRGPSHCHYALPASVETMQWTAPAHQPGMYPSVGQHVPKQPVAPQSLKRKVEYVQLENRNMEGYMAPVAEVRAVKKVRLQGAIPVSAVVQPLDDMHGPQAQSPSTMAAVAEFLATNQEATGDDVFEYNANEMPSGDLGDFDFGFDPTPPLEQTAEPAAKQQHTDGGAAPASIGVGEVLPRADGKSPPSVQGEQQKTAVDPSEEPPAQEGVHVEPAFEWSVDQMLELNSSSGAQQVLDDDNIWGGHVTQDEWDDIFGKDPSTEEPAPEERADGQADQAETVASAPSDSAVEVHPEEIAQGSRGPESPSSSPSKSLQLANLISA
ncbi:hypothetical protein DL762_003992 [Monosporascus cannonballus]|uniref:Uncharacterized protein n=1 Tax=Monosporascus cannonballus TaxID=155416 RepID=A0ABY0H9K7_9PEZI|nr:hypothetical protein DL762_003992 [Monosporascus cannonballus]